MSTHVSDISAMVLRHDEDLYRGNPPGTGLTTRVAVVEAELARFGRNANKLVWSVVGLLVAVLAELVKGFFLK
ncbi:MAG TPA: hypothetical protein VHB45_14350 [Alloacidobacterium sp.]|nr:hypothetical protein [Alloacidobacterium sp.]